MTVLGLRGVYITGSPFTCGMELHKLQILARKAGSRDHRSAVAGGGVSRGAAEIRAPVSPAKPFIISGCQTRLTHRSKEFMKTPHSLAEASISIRKKSQTIEWDLNEHGYTNGHALPHLRWPSTWKPVSPVRISSAGYSFHPPSTCQCKMVAITMHKKDCILLVANLRLSWRIH